MSFDEKSWRRTIFEALRSIDPNPLFKVSIDEIDFRAVGGAVPEHFPVDEFAEFVEAWVASLGPTGNDLTTDWIGGGVRLVIRARGRRPDR
jgi:hypothetical protein